MGYRPALADTEALIAQATATAVAVDGSKTDRFTKRKNGKAARLVDFGSEI